MYKGLIIKVVNTQREYKGSLKWVDKPSKTTYIKIIGDKNSYNYYPYVKCTKNGKEFSERNGYSQSLIEKVVSQGKVEVDMINYKTVWSVHKLPGEVASEKVSTEGKEAGIKKRRLQHLRQEVARYQAEIATLEQELGESN